MNRESPILSDIRKTFGEDTVKEGILDRKLLAKRAFKDRTSTEKLNRITHPYIYELSLLEIEEYSQKGFDKFILDAPVLFESRGERYCSVTIAVTAELDIRIERIMCRDNLTREEAMVRINAQQSNDFYIKRADYHIENNGEQSETEQKICKIIERF